MSNLSDVTDLRSVDEALSQILAQVQPLAPEHIPLGGALQRVLAADVVAQVSLPPFPNSSMDGFALRAVDVAEASPVAPVAVQVVMDIPAGQAPTQALGAGQAARIMTGAPMPEGADAVVPIEQTDATWAGPVLGEVRILQAVQAGAYVRPMGEDISAGQTALGAGTRLRPQELGVLAALGVATVPVIRRPRVAVLTNGDELVTVEQPLTPGKIRDVNSYTLAGLIQDCGAEPLVLPIAADTPEAIAQMFSDALAQKPDMIVSSAGVSVGAADYVKATLAQMGQVAFWRINLRPGKPLAYGHLQGIPFFGLPGNPVSVMVTFDVLVRPALLKLGGRADESAHTTAITGEAMRSDGRRSYIRVKLHTDEAGQLIASSTGTQSSGALMSMVLADGLLIIPEGVTQVPPGTRLQVRLLRP